MFISKLAFWINHFRRNMNKVIKFSNNIKQLREYWSPRILAEANDQYIKIAKVKGEFVWHKHNNEEEFFFLLKGSLTIEMQEGTVILHEGDGFVVPKNTLHRPIAKKECWIMLIEPKSTKHTGEEITPLTRDISDQITNSE